MEAASIIEKADEDRPTSSARSCSACGARSPAAGRRTRRSSRRAARSVTETLLELARPQPGERVLELACGAGGVGHRGGARSSSPGGEVVLSDVAPEMTAIARGARGGARARATSRTRELDLEQIDEPDASFDVVLCREGLMLVPDPARAVARDRARAAPGRPRRARRVGPARAATRGSASCSTRSREQLGIADAAARASRARSRSPTRTARRAARRRGPRRRRVGGAADAVPRRLGRGVVGEDGGAGRPARAAAGRAARAGAPGAVRPRARRDQRVRDADGARDPGRVARSRRPRARDELGSSARSSAPRHCSGRATVRALTTPERRRASSASRHLSQSCDRHVTPSRLAFRQGTSGPLGKPRGTCQSAPRSRAAVRGRLATGARR